MCHVPLLVHFVYHPGSQAGSELALRLHAHLNDDPGVPGLRVPTTFAVDDGSGSAPACDSCLEEAERVAVVLLADDYLAAAAGKPRANGRPWGDYVAGLCAACSESRRHRFFPVQLSRAAWPLDARLSGVNFLRAWGVEEGPERQALVADRLVHALCQLLGPEEVSDGGSPVTVFVSHSKLDIDIEPKVVRCLLAELAATQPEKTWFDSGDIETGSQFAQAIENGVRDSALIAVLTDSYASRAWCRREILLAKHYERPVVVIDALRDGEIRSFPYVGNVPVLRWQGKTKDAISALLRETLRHLHARALLGKRKRPEDDILPTRPELVTLAKRSVARTILYPDPPLGQEELDVLASTGLTLETPLERFAKEAKGVCASRPLALSVGESEDIARWGLREEHLEATYLEISRYLLLAGIRLAYGGHLGTAGYAIRLFDLLKDPTVERVRAGRAAGHSSQDPKQIENYVGWPIPFSVHDEARFAMLVRTERTPRPPGVDESLDPTLVEEPDAWIDVSTPARRYAWARGMTAVRERLSADTAARIAVGGKLGPGSKQSGKWYSGRIPGMLEEILLSLNVERPVFLVGAFGGCTRAVFDVLEGRERPELTWEWQKNAPYAEGMRALYEERGEPWFDYPDMVAALRRRGLDGLGNGLTAAENRELGVTRSAERIIELILGGLRKSCHSLDRASVGGLQPTDGDFRG